VWAEVEYEAIIAASTTKAIISRLCDKNPIFMVVILPCVFKWRVTRLVRGILQILCRIEYPFWTADAVLLCPV
jgi:hypothetical protein